jgi:hypothetical protein
LPFDRISNSVARMFWLNSRHRPGPAPAELLQRLCQVEVQFLSGPTNQGDHMSTPQIVSLGSREEFRSQLSSYAAKGFTTVNNDGAVATLSRKKPPSSACSSPSSTGSHSFSC